MIQDVDGHGPVLFVESPFNLPDIFWVRALHSWFVQYEILPGDNDGKPLQLQQTRQAGGATLAMN
jgi:hypothetical protein